MEGLVPQRQEPASAGRGRGERIVPAPDGDCWAPGQSGRHLRGGALARVRTSGRPHRIYGSNHHFPWVRFTLRKGAMSSEEGALSHRWHPISGDRRSGTRAVAPDPGTNEPERKAPHSTFCPHWDLWCGRGLRLLPDLPPRAGRTDPVPTLRNPVRPTGGRSRLRSCPPGCAPACRTTNPLREVASFRPTTGMPSRGAATSQGRSPPRCTRTRGARTDGPAAGTAVHAPKGAPPVTPVGHPADTTAGRPRLSPGHLRA